MLRLTLDRLASAVPILLIVTLGVFLLVDLAPGDAAYSLAGDNPTPEQVEQTRQELGLDDPLLTRYGRSLGHPIEAPATLRRRAVDEFATIDRFDGPALPPAG